MHMKEQVKLVARPRNHRDLTPGRTHGWAFVVRRGPVTQRQDLGEIAVEHGIKPGHIDAWRQHHPLDQRGDRVHRFRGQLWVGQQLFQVLHLAPVERWQVRVQADGGGRIAFRQLLLRYPKYQLQLQFYNKRFSIKKG